MRPNIKMQHDIEMKKILISSLLDQNIMFGSLNDCYILKILDGLFLKVIVCLHCRNVKSIYKKVFPSLSIENVRKNKNFSIL